MKFEFRKSCEYTVEVEADNVIEAWAKLPDNGSWEQSWTGTEVEEV